ncbi:hypothetical protein EPD60_11555 [Flaviaesturariibacter flavus]|uniref:Uncharacterized protein n=1 Tax=Flaviaesturariibacter flavus TaxID=2502780 RepID=A0A4R1B9Y9_9BACT|nr:hypothetical protein [Flaviaesturariibacter flavus]TCJ13727.1 hypothetical protein EPD60_11555 [Flaviaesturariibacter flavus]
MSGSLYGVRAIILLLVVVSGFYLLPKNIRAYFRIIVALALLALIWLSTGLHGNAMKLILSVIILGGMVPAHWYLRDTPEEEAQAEDSNLLR